MSECFAYVYVCVGTMCMLCAQRGQKRTLDPLKLKLHVGDCEPVHGYWGLNPGLLGEQPVLLTAVPSLQLECDSDIIDMINKWGEISKSLFQKIPLFLRGYRVI